MSNQQHTKNLFEAFDDKNKSSQIKQNLSENINQGQKQPLEGQQFKGQLFESNIAGQEKNFNKNQGQNLQGQGLGLSEKVHHHQKHELPEYNFDPDKLPEIPEKEISADPEEAIKQLDKINEEQNMRIH